jgi:hypothetical protein
MQFKHAYEKGTQIFKQGSIFHEEESISIGFNARIECHPITGREFCSDGGRIDVDDPK